MNPMADQDIKEDIRASRQVFETNSDMSDEGLVDNDNVSETKDPIGDQDIKEDISASQRVFETKRYHVSEPTTSNPVTELVREDVETQGGGEIKSLEPTSRILRYISDADDSPLHGDGGDIDLKRRPSGPGLSQPGAVPVSHPVSVDPGFAPAGMGGSGEEAAPEEARPRARHIDDPRHPVPGAYAHGRDNGEINQGRNTPTEMFQNHNEETIVEARAIPDEELAEAIVEASEVDQSGSQETGQRSNKRLRENLTAGGFVVVLLFILLGIILAVVLFAKSSDQPTNLTSKTPVPSVSPTTFPSMPPTGMLDTMMAYLPSSTLERLTDPFSVQSQAYDWLISHPGLPDMPMWKRMQLFALATFFFAFEGPNWPDGPSRNWLTYDKDECYWYSSEFGYFMKNGTWVQLEGYDSDYNHGVITCNEKGEFTSLMLELLDLGGLSPYLPPELGLLKALKVVALGQNHIDMPLADLVPADSGVYDLPNLQLLDFYWNNISSTIPAKFGELTTLQTLYLDENLLTGPIPSQLGRLGNITDFAVFINSLSGTIPTQLGLWTNTEILVLDANHFVGSIPTEFGGMPNLKRLWAHDNSLTGTIPSGFDVLVRNYSMHVLTTEDNYLSGTVSEALCSLGDLDWDYLNLDGDTANGVTFDCNDNLCGCSWCPCFPTNESGAVEFGINETDAQSTEFMIP